MTMIQWLESVIGTLPGEYEFIYYLIAGVLVIVLVTNVINLFFSPLRIFK